MVRPVSGSLQQEIAVRHAQQRERLVAAETALLALVGEAAHRDADEAADARLDPFQLGAGGRVQRNHAAVGQVAEAQRQGFDDGGLVDLRRLLRMPTDQNEDNCRADSRRCSRRSRPGRRS